MLSEGLPKITIVTPSFNQGRFIRETIESVLNQDYENLEYFIVDGGSDDNTVDIIREYEDRIDWWISEKDNGQADALFKGFSCATGDLIGWLNSDDIYFPGALRKIGEAYAENPCASIYSGGLAIGEKGDGGIIKCSIPTKPLAIFSLFGMRGFGQQSSFFRAGDYRKTGGMDTNIYMRMDGDIMHRLLTINPSVVVIDDMVGFFRWHESSKSTVADDRYYSERDKFISNLDISPVAFYFRRISYKIYRFVSGGYLKSWVATKHLRGKRMSEIWARENSAHGSGAL